MDTTFPIIEVKFVEKQQAYLNVSFPVPGSRKTEMLWAERTVANADIDM